MSWLSNKAGVKDPRGPWKLLRSSNKVSAVNAMRDRSTDSFRQHLLEKYSLPPRARARVETSGTTTVTRPLREFCEATDLPAADFADEVSEYFGLPRLSLPQLLATTPRLEGFSRRFLRESTIFPFSAPNGGLRLAVADPSD